MANENAVMGLHDLEYAEIQGTDLDELEEMLQGQLEETLEDLNALKEEREKIGNPDSLGQTVQDEIWKQFANQVGLDLTNETLIQQYDREHPDETYDKVKDEVMQDKRYRDANNEMKRQQEAGELKDSYTGKDLRPGDKANLDHVISRKEIFENQRRKQAGLSTQDLANQPENLAPTNENLNKSKSDKSVDEYLAHDEQRREDLRKQNERANEKVNNDPNLSPAEKKAKIEKNNRALQNKLDADPKLLKKKDKSARWAQNKKIIVGTAKSTAKKAGKDFLKTVAVDALFKLLKEIMNGFVRWIKSAGKSFNELLKEMKRALTSFFQKLKSAFQVGASSAVGTIVSEIFGPIVSTFKKMASFIKQGISSFVEAIKYLTNKENKEKPLSVKIAQIGKIVTGGLAGGGAIVLGEVFEKYLLTVPGMQLTIPLLGTLAHVIGLFLGSLIAGLIGAIVMNLIDKFIAKRLRDEADRAIIKRGNDVLKIQDAQINVAQVNMNKHKKEVATEILERHKACSEHMEDAKATIAFNENDVPINDCHSENEVLQGINDALDSLI